MKLGQVKLNQPHKPLLPWGGETPHDIEEVEKALFRIFLTDEGKILWAYLKQTVIENHSVESDITKIHIQNGKRILAMHLKSLANRQLEK